MKKKWTKETVFEESRKYTSKSEFKKNCSGAFRVAYTNGWLTDMSWLKHPEPQPIRWTKDAVIKESKKYLTISDFIKGSRGAYEVA